MRVAMSATAVLCADVEHSSRLFIDHLGFEATVQLDWYIDLVHPDQPGHHLAFVQRDHASLPDGLRGGDEGGFYVALVIDEVEAEVERLAEAGVPVVVPVSDEPWGQRRGFIGGADGLLVELLQITEPDPEWLRAQGLSA